MGGGGGRLASGSLVHLTDLGRAPEEMVVVRGQEGMTFDVVAGVQQYRHCDNARQVISNTITALQEKYSHYLERSIEVLSDLENANILGCIMAHHDEFEGNPKAYTTFFLKVAPFKGQVTNSGRDTSMDLYTDSLLAFGPPAAKVVRDIYTPLKTYAEAVKKTSCRAPCPAPSTFSATSTLSTTSSTSSKHKYKRCHTCQKMGHIRQECPYHR